jgi:phosphoglycerol transferase MdoB-like AlkP superfamily enzyme
MDKQTFDIYRDYINQLREARLKSYEQFDKTIITMSSGGLALSLAFLKDFIAWSDARNGWCLITSWILFAISLLSVLISFYFSPFEIDKQLNLTEDYYIEGKKESFRAKNTWTCLLKSLNAFSIITLMVAVAFTLAFVIGNLDVTKGGK